ncbi:hypothetical protein ACFPAF_04145 [Hymenobacter endophyticus]|uniref:DUF1795 domain-containing protein n=1 Tax=Hymenobacter endophyticus TaxID=3076335 RepID=A0ABU3TE12_9BACT|nr:hypothetical protein [Hymenobacter endophyticus]MDU0369575.1 hypothetical protein [Hymenobacter endophyticus]
MLRTLLIAASLSFGAATSVNAQMVQTFPKDKFMVACDCKLYPDQVHMKMVRESGSNVPVSAYVCAANKDSYEQGSITNITIQDNSANYKAYKSMSPTQAAAVFETGLLKQYYSNLQANGIRAEYTSYRGVKAIRYSFNMMETMPAEAIFFLKNRKAYLLQVASRTDVDSKFQTLVGTFHFLQ